MKMRCVGEKTLSAENGQNAGRYEAGRNSFQRDGHVVYGAESNALEATLCRHLLHSPSPNPRFEAQSAYGFAEEGRFLALGFSEGNLNLRQEKLDRESRESSARTEVEKRRVCGKKWSEVKTDEEALAKVPADNLFRVADGGEIGSGVPPEEQIEVNAELGVEGRRYWCVREIRLKEFGDLGFAEGHGIYREAAS